MLLRLPPWLSLSVALTATGCGCGGGDATAADAGEDGGYDAGADADAGIDAGRDAAVQRRDGGPPDGGADAGFDGGPNPAGWTPLPGLPEGCVVERAEHPEVLFRPTWEGCGEGCEQFVQDPSRPSGFDPQVGGHDGSRGYFAVIQADRVDRGRIVVLAATEGAPVGAWKGPPFDGEHLCQVGAMAVSSSSAAFVLRIGGTDRPYEERIYHAPLGEIGRATEPVAIVDESWLPGSAIQRLAVSDTTVAGEVPLTGYVVVAEGGGLFRVQSPGDAGRPQKPQMVGRTVFWDDQGERNRIARGTATEPAAYYHEAASADLRGPRVGEEWVAWQQASPPGGPYTLVELWASPFAETPGDLAPRRLATLEGFYGSFAMGAGVYAVFAAYDRIDLYDLADGRKRMFRVPAGSRVFNGPSYITADELLVPGRDEDGSTLFRVELGSLPYE